MREISILGRQRDLLRLSIVCVIPILLHNDSVLLFLGDAVDWQILLLQRPVQVLDRLHHFVPGSTVSTGEKRISLSLVMQHEGSVLLLQLLGLEQSQSLETHDLNLAADFQLALVIKLRDEDGARFRNKQLHTLILQLQNPHHIYRKNYLLAANAAQCQLPHTIITIEAKLILKYLSLHLSLLLLKTIIAHLRHLLLLLDHALEAGLAGPGDLEGVFTGLEVGFDVLDKDPIDFLLEIKESLILGLLDPFGDCSKKIVHSVASRTDQYDWRCHNGLNLLHY